MSKRFIRSQSALIVQICGIAIAFALVVLTFVRERTAEHQSLERQLDHLIVSANLRVSAVALALVEHQPWDQEPVERDFCQFAKFIVRNYPFVVGLLRQQRFALGAQADGLACTGQGEAVAVETASPALAGQARPINARVTAISHALEGRMGDVARLSALPDVVLLDFPKRQPQQKLLALRAPRVDGGAIDEGPFAVVDPTALFTEASAELPARKRLGEAITVRPAQSTTRSSITLPPVWCLLSCTTYSAARNVVLANGNWTVQLSEAAPSLLDRHGGSISVALLGLILSALWVMHVRNAQSAALQVADMVERREAELQSLNEILIEDIERRKRTMDELSRSRTQLRQLTEHNARIKEDERTRIAREIHDDLGQSMMVLRIDLSLIAEDDLAPATRVRVQRALAQIDQTVTAMRLIINELRPAVLDLGLDAAIDWESRKFSRRSGISCSLDLQIGNAELSAPLITAFYRITQESLTNIMRHSQARSTQIRLWIDREWLFLKISDDGIGMDEGPRHNTGSFGLIGIAERAFALGGAFHLESAPGKGTQMLIAAPLQPPPAIS